MGSGHNELLIDDGLSEISTGLAEGQFTRLVGTVACLLSVCRRVAATSTSGKSQHEEAGYY